MNNNINEQLESEDLALLRQQQSQSNHSVTEDDEIDLTELLMVIWRGKWKIVFISLAFAAVAAFYALSLSNIYRSSVLLMPNTQEQSAGGLGGLASQFGGLASLAGINLGSGGTDKTGYALQVIKSREFLYNFIQQNDLKLEVMAVDGWDRGSDTYSYNPDVYDHNTKQWVRDVSAPYQPEPSLHETYEEFLKQNLSVSQDKENGMVTIAIQHFSPHRAQQLVEKLTEALNETIKQQDLEEATRSIEYLEKELKNTTESGMQTMFYQLIEQQQQTLMLTKVRSDYVLKVVDKAIIPEDKFKPKRAFIVILGGIVGGIVSIFLVLVLSFKGKSRD